MLIMLIIIITIIINKPWIIIMIKLGVNPSW